MNGPPLMGWTDRTGWTGRTDRSSGRQSPKFAPASGTGTLSRAVCGAGIEEAQDRGDAAVEFRALAQP